MTPRKPKEFRIGQPYRMRGPFGRSPGKAVAVITAMERIDSRSTAVSLMWLDDNERPCIFTLAQFRDAVFCEERKQ